jgi:luciferase family oxidoreductase group 1
MALQHGPGALPIEHFPQQVGDLLDYLKDQVRPDHPFFGVHAQPSGPSAPEPWLLGSSDQSAVFAAHFGTAFSFAHFITDRGGVEVMDAYRQYFRPSSWLDRPMGSIGVFALAAETDAAAERLARSRDLWRLRLEQGILGPIPTVEEAEAYPYSEDDRRRIAFHRRRQLVGSAATVKDGLSTLAASYGVEEVVVVSICYDHQARLRSYELIAEACGLDKRS